MAVAANAQYEKRSDDDFEVQWFQSLGAGGQNANKHHNCARVIHLPTGLRQESKGKSRESNLRQAKAALIQMLDQMVHDERHGKLSDTRKAQVGSGMRGDKIRTIRSQDNTAKDHQTGKSCQADRLMAGNFDLLW